MLNIMLHCLASNSLFAAEDTAIEEVTYAWFCENRRLIASVYRTIKDKSNSSSNKADLNLDWRVWLEAKDLATNEMYCTSEPATETSWRLGITRGI